MPKPKWERSPAGNKKLILEFDCHQAELRIVGDSESTNIQSCFWIDMSTCDPMQNEVTEIEALRLAEKVFRNALEAVSKLRKEAAE